VGEALAIVAAFRSVSKAGGVMIITLIALGVAAPSSAGITLENQILQYW
jgi:hypothetical protein